MCSTRFWQVLVVAIAVTSFGCLPRASSSHRELLTTYFELSDPPVPAGALSRAERKAVAAYFNRCVDIYICVFSDRWPPVDRFDRAETGAMLTHIDDLLLSLTRSMKKVPKEIAWDCLRDRVRREPQGRSAYLCILLAGDLRLTCSREDLRRLGLSRNGPAYIRWVAALALTHLDDWSAEVALWEGIESGDVLPPDAEFMDAEHVASHRESWRGHTVCRLALGPSPAGRVRRFCELFRDPRIGKEATRAIAKVLGSFKDDPLALSSLEEALGDKSRPSTVRWQCAESLGLQGHRSSLAALAKALEDEGWGVRASAAEAIGSIIGQGFQATDEGIEQARRWLAEQKDLR